MRYTERGRTTLDEYLSTVRRSLEGDSGVDAAEVVAGIREHVETELTERAVEPATAEDVAEVLAQLGPANSLGDASGERATLEPLGQVAAQWPAIAVLILAVFGLALAATRLAPVGWALLITAVVAARVIVPFAHAGSIEGRLVRALWQLGAAGAMVILLIGPAVLIWASAQIGGVIEEPLARHVDIVGGERPFRYWLVMAMVAGALTGAWWMLLGVFVRRLSAQIARAAGPARHLVPVSAARVLPLIGAVVVILSLIGLWMS